MLRWIHLKQKDGVQALLNIDHVVAIESTGRDIVLTTARQEYYLDTCEEGAGSETIRAVAEVLQKDASTDPLRPVMTLTEHATDDEEEQ